MTVLGAHDADDAAPPSRGSRLAHDRLRLGAVVLVLAVVIVGLALATQEPDLSPPAAAPPPWDPSGPVINEIVSSNASTLTDASGDAPDWIELQNPTDEAVDLTGWFLSDDDDQPDRWVLPEVVLAPGEHLVVFASGRDLVGLAGELHTDFRIAQQGEPVLLVEPDGRTVADRFPPVELPRDASFGRDPGAPSRLCFFAFPTPGQENAPECFDDADLGAPAFSATSGFFDGAVNLEITPAVDDATVIFTLDGSFPDLDTNPERTRFYEEPLRIGDRSEGGVQAATVVRARTIFSAERVATFFVGAHLRREGLPVLSLALNDEYLFDPDTGIYVDGRASTESGDPEDRNVRQRGRDWERPFSDDLRPGVVLDVCDGQGDCGYQTRVGVRMQGGRGRDLPHKALRLYARSDYGDRTFAHPFFGDAAPADHRRILLRNSGNDAHGVLLLDGYAQSLMTHFHADTQAYQPATLFINGEYWGIHNLRERYDRHYIETVHGADADRVVLLGPHLEVAAGGPDAADAFRDLVDRVAATAPGDPEVVARVEAEMDLDSFIDFLIAHIYVGNRDWPGNNIRLWREPDGPDAVGEGPRDGRWRWMIFDLDHMGGRFNRFDAGYNVFDERMAPVDRPGYLAGIPLLFHRLVQDDEFRDRFLQRFADHLNTAFHPDLALPRIDELENLLDEEIALHSQRWGTPSSVEAWRTDLGRLRAFMAARPDIQRRHLVELLGLDGTATVAVRTDSEAGFVRVNTIDIAPGTPGVDDPADWRGTYFLGVPMRLEAVPTPGHRFVRWDGLTGGEAAEARIEVLLDRDVDLAPVFAPE